MSGKSLRLGAEALSLLRRAAKASRDPVWLVGGALRDSFLGRRTPDLDLVTSAARPLAKSLAQSLGGRLVVLDERNAVFRVVLPKAKTVRQVDVAGLQGRDIAADLGRRDFTINAIALPLRPNLPGSLPVSALLDPRRGLADLARRLVRAESADPFLDDPLRLMRAFRIAAQLGFEIEAETLRLIGRLRHRVRQPAAERVQAELLALLSIPGCSRWLRLMDESRLLTALLPELEPMRQCALVYYGPGGVMTHSLDTVARADFLLTHLGRVFPRQAQALSRHVESRLPGGVSHRAVLVLAALLHDIAKPETARRMGGRLRFFGHDLAGARRAAEVLKRLKFSREHADTVSNVIAHHLRPGNLAAGPAVTDKAVYRFFRDLGDDAVSLLLVCWADHASYLPEERLLKGLRTACADIQDFSLGRRSLSRVKPPEDRKTFHHLQLIAHLIRRRFEEPGKALPEKLIDGHDVMKALGLPPGPKVGEVLDLVREAQAEGKIRSRREALSFLIAKSRPFLIR